VKENLGKKELGKKEPELELELEQVTEAAWVLASPFDLASPVFLSSPLTW
jgi:hypothetical protein